jgi:hypothetical protein
MKFWFLAILISSPAFALSIKGKVDIEPACGSGKAMVWLSKKSNEFAKKELLMHTLVPHKGTFEFYVIAGDYNVEISTEKGCASTRTAYVSNEDVFLNLAAQDSK